MANIGRLGVAFAALALAAGGTIATGTAASASSKVYAYGPGDSGHAGYVYSTDHGWVCDDHADGREVYAVWTFHGGAGNTHYRANAPAHGHGCKGNRFTKSPIAVKVCLDLPHRVDECGSPVKLD